MMPDLGTAIRRLAGSLLAAFAVAACNGTEAGDMGRRVEQPVAFNHQLHIVDLEMDCTECHRYVTTSRKATLPTAEVCADCHSEPQGESAEEEKLVSLISSGEDLNWQRVYVLPKHVYFSHFRHVTLGQMGCPECHGSMNELSRPPRQPAVNILDMDYCVDCHEDQLVSNDCLACHI
jgi:predicted CXXCH cytochrome family protein